MKQPRCPSCNWFLSIESVDKSWVARCENRFCSVDVVPPTINRSLVVFVQSSGEVTSVAVAERFGWTVQNAVNHLTRLTDLGILSRRRIDPVRGGKRFVWKHVGRPSRGLT
jgi:hypothetical protein